MTAVLSCAVIMIPQSSGYQVAASQEPPPLDQLITWLDDRSSAWVATAWLQQLGEPAIDALLASGRIQTGPHGRFSARMLALAKIGEPAIPHILKKTLMPLSRTDQDSSEASALVKVLGSIGPAAIPALVEMAAKSPSWISSRALEEIMALEPATEAFGQDVSPWNRWRPQNDRSVEIARLIAPCLPRIEEVMDRQAKAWRPQSPAPHRPAAYLLARWGDGRERARGLNVLKALARTDEPFYYHLESAMLLHRLRAPDAAAVIKEIAGRVTNQTGEKDQYLLRIGVALFQLGDQSYVELIKSAMRSSNRTARIEAIRFAQNSGDLSLAPSMIDLLGDTAETGSQTVETINGRTITTRQTIGEFAADSLRRLTFQSIARDAAAWRAWWENHRKSSYSDVLQEFLGSYSDRVESIPMWEANQLIADLSGISDPLIFPLFREYLDRKDLDASRTGPNSFKGGGGDGPGGIWGPQIVTSLLRMAQLGHREGQSLLGHAMEVVDPRVRIFAAMAVGSYDRSSAIDSLVREMEMPDRGYRYLAADYLILLGDNRGIPDLIDRLEDKYEATRHRACGDLRLYTQQTFPCDGRLPADVRAANVKRWRSWWSSALNFEPKVRQAALDRLASPEVIPVSYSSEIIVQ